MKSPLTLAWREAVREFLPAGTGITAFYKSLNWHKTGRLSALTRTPDLRMSVLLEIADQLGVDRVRFFRRVLAAAVESGQFAEAPARRAGRRKKLLAP